MKVGPPKKPPETVKCQNRQTAGISPVFGGVELTPH